MMPAVSPSSDDAQPRQKSGVLIHAGNNDMFVLLLCTRIAGIVTRSQRVESIAKLADGASRGWA